MRNLFEIENFNFNPFGGLNETEIQEVIVPKIPVKSFLNLLNSKDQLIFQLVGKKGRGKTLHLKYLHQFVKDSPIFLLSNKSNDQALFSNQSDIIFVDSIHHLSFLKRLQLYNSTKKIILTTHISRSWEYKIVGKYFESIRFSGINKEVLKKIISNRLEIASIAKDSKVSINDNKLDELIKIYNDDYRGIINSLFDEFQKTNKI